MKTRAAIIERLLEEKHITSKEAIKLMRKFVIIWKPNIEGWGKIQIDSIDKQENTPFKNETHLKTL